MFTNFLEYLTHCLLALYLTHTPGVYKQPPGRWKEMMTRGILMIDTIQRRTRGCNVGALCSQTNYLNNKINIHGSCSPNPSQLL
jgi:hypothetical protein